MTNKTKPLTREDFVKWGMKGGIKSGIIRKQNKLRKLENDRGASQENNDLLTQPPSDSKLNNEQKES